MLFKRIFKNAFVILTLIFGYFNYSSAQEIIEPLRYNRVLAHTDRSYIMRSLTKIDTFYITNTSPFFDDFSQNSFLPKDSLWIDRDVFINNTSAHLPPTIGVATFDGLNEFGLPYSPGAAEGSGVPCDTLTSVPIFLANYQESDSLYLSFFYQPQGYGDLPDTYDSLVVEYKPDSLWLGTLWDKTAWVRVWSIKGSGLKPFKQVLLPVKHYKIDPNDPVQQQIANFYHGGFQFRFINYGNPSGNLNLWNVDYVYLNKGRNRYDTVYEDIAIVKMPQSLLNNYTSVPASHLINDHSLIRNKQYLYASNLFNTQENIKGSYSVKNVANQQVLLPPSNSNTNITNQTVFKLKVYDSITTKFPFGQLSGDTINLLSEISTFYIKDIHKENDVVDRLLEFSNYYAYDDGTAENGYSIDLGAYKSGAVAYKFKLAKNVKPEDSIRGVEIFFNYSQEDVSEKPFNLIVWKNYKQNTLRSIPTVIPSIVDSQYNGFYIYKFEHPLGVDSLADADGVFYIGWQQNSAYRMNVGLDRNYYDVKGDEFPDKADSIIFYYTANTWHSSVISGALMMRPIISKYELKLPVGIKENEKFSKSDIKIYPNPAKDHVSIFTGIDNGVLMTLTDIQGRIQKRELIHDNAVLSLSGINPGIYIIILDDGRTHVKTYHKLIIQK